MAAETVLHSGREGPKVTTTCISAQACSLFWVGPGVDGAPLGALQ